MIPHWKDYPPSEISPEAWKIAKEAFFSWAITLVPHYPETKIKEFDATIEDLCSKGWNRGDIYAVIEDCLWEEKNRKRMSEFQIDVLGDYLNDMCGHCSPSLIERLPCDPKEVDIVEYTRGMKWRKGGPKTS